MGKDFSVVFYSNAAFAYTDQRNDTPHLWYGLRKNTSKAASEAAPGESLLFCELLKIRVWLQH